MKFRRMRIEDRRRKSEIRWYTAMCCGRRGLAFAMQDTYYQIVRRHGETIYCPAGHSSCFPHSDAAVQAELSTRQELEKAVNTARAEIAAIKGQLVTLRHFEEQAEARARRGSPCIATPTPSPD